MWYERWHVYSPLFSVPTRKPRLQMVWYGNNGESNDAKQLPAFLSTGLAWVTFTTICLRGAGGAALWLCRLLKWFYRITSSQSAEGAAEQNTVHNLFWTCRLHCFYILYFILFVLHVAPTSSNSCWLSGTAAVSLPVMNEPGNIISHFARGAQENSSLLSGVTLVLQPSAQQVLLSCVISSGDL